MSAARQKAAPHTGHTAVLQINPLFVDRVTAAHALSLSQSTFYELVRSGMIAKPLLVSPGRVGWRWTDLVAYANSRPEADLLPPPNTDNRRSKTSANDAPQVG